jgi:single-strand DNA-binding protein
MNLAIIIGRATKDPDYSEKNDSKVAKYTLAVDRYKQDADFISCVCFGKNAEFARDYIRKGTKIAVVGSIKTGSYENKEGKKVYTTDIIVDRHEFVESKGNKIADAAPETTDNTPVEVPDSIADSLPFV